MGNGSNTAKSTLNENFFLMNSLLLKKSNPTSSEYLTIVSTLPQANLKTGLKSRGEIQKCLLVKDSESLLWILVPERISYRLKQTFSQVSSLVLWGTATVQNSRVCRIIRKTSNTYVDNCLPPNSELHGILSSPIHAVPLGINVCKTSDKDSRNQKGVKTKHVLPVGVVAIECTDRCTYACPHKCLGLLNIHHLGLWDRAGQCLNSAQPHRHLEGSSNLGTLRPNL